MKLLSLAFPVLLVAGALAVQSGAFTGLPPDDLGVRDGRLKAPSLTRNSVSSQVALHPDHPQRAYADMAPLPLKAGDAGASMQALARALAATPGVVIVQQEPDYLRAEASTRWLRFVDDLEFSADPTQGVIHLRSASRLGREDLGTNRERMERIRAAYATLP